MNENKNITNMDVDFAKWYTDVVKAAKLAEYTNVKGCIAIEPNGYAIWENIQSILDKKFKELGHQNLYMPLLIPESLLNKEKEHVEGFAPEVAWVTELGNKKLEERCCIRPTSEVLFCDYWKDKLTTYRQLPMLYNQWCNIFRAEKETRPFLRSREFLWQEGHTLHETAKEAEEETNRMLEVYIDFFENYLAIPVLTGKKTEKEKFSGAEYTLTIEALMHNGVSLQSGTTHYFGQKFTKAFDITYLNRENKLDYPYQSSWGVSTRMLAALIMVHGDNKGLILPPNIAPKQVAIIPIGEDKDIINEVNKIYNELKDNSILCYIDNSDRSPGYKFAEAEVNGIPLRIELGSRDLSDNKLTLARRDTYEKITVDRNNLIDEVNNILKSIQDNLYNKAKNNLDSKTFTAIDIKEMERIINETPGFIKASWCGNEECEIKIKEINGIKSRCILENEKLPSDKCVCCGNEAKHLVVWGIQY